MASSFVKFECLGEDITKKVHNFDTDTIKVVLSNTAPSASSNTTLSDITQIASGGGYTTGGEDVQNSISRSSGTTSIIGVDVRWTATGNGFGPFRYVILYNDTATNDPLIGYWDIGTTTTIPSGAWMADFGSSLFTIS